MNFFKNRKSSAQEVPDESHDTVSSSSTSVMESESTQPNSTQASSAAEPMSEAAGGQDAPVASGASDIEDLKAKIGKLAEQYNDARLGLQSALFLRKEMLANQLKSIQRQLDASTQQDYDLHKKLEELKTADQSELEQKIAELKDEQDKIVTRQQAKQTERDRTTKSTDDANKKLKALESQLSDVADELGSLADKMREESDATKIVNLAEKERNRIFALNDKKAGLKRDQKQLKEELADLNKQGEQKDADLEALAASIKKSKDKSEDLRSQQSKQEQAHEREMRRVEGDLKTLASRHARQKQELENLQSEQVKLNAELFQWLGSNYKLTPLQLTTDSNVALFLDSFLPRNVNYLTRLAQLLLNRGAAKIHVYTGQFDINIAAEIQGWVKNAGLKDDQIVLENPLVQLARTSNPQHSAFHEPENVVGERWDDAHLIHSLELQDGTRMAIMYAKEDPKLVQRIDTGKDNQLVKRTYFNLSGILAANMYFDAEQRPQREEYFRDNGTVFLTTNYEEGKLVAIQLLDGAGLMRNSFKSVADFNLWWIKQGMAPQTSFIGMIGSSDYASLIKEAKLDAMPFVDADANEEQIKSFDSAIPATHFIVADYQQQQRLTKTLGRDLELLMLEDSFLPVSIATPVKATLPQPAESDETQKEEKVSSVAE